MSAHRTFNEVVHTAEGILLSADRPTARRLIELHLFDPRERRHFIGHYERADAITLLRTLQPGDRLQFRYVHARLVWRILSITLKGTSDVEKTLQLVRE